MTNVRYEPQFCEQNYLHLKYFQIKIFPLEMCLKFSEQFPIGNFPPHMRGSQSKQGM
jgi:hypothetical protein